MQIWLIFIDLVTYCFIIIPKGSNYIGCTNSIICFWYCYPLQTFWLQLKIETHNHFVHVLIYVYKGSTYVDHCTVYLLYINIFWKASLNWDKLAVGSDE